MRVVREAGEAEAHLVPVEAVGADLVEDHRRDLLEDVATERVLKRGADERDRHAELLAARDLPRAAVGVAHKGVFVALEVLIARDQLRIVVDQALDAGAQAVQLLDGLAQADAVVGVEVARDDRAMADVGCASEQELGVIPAAL